MPAFAESAAEPPLADSYYSLLRRAGSDHNKDVCCQVQAPPVSECELPMIDVGCLATGGGTPEERAACAAAITAAASEWGFFQVVNHGVGQELLDAMRREQVRLFRLPFEAKTTAGLLNDSYRWGTQTATSPGQLSWSEAFHVPLAGISGDRCSYGELNAISEVAVGAEAAGDQRGPGPPPTCKNQFNTLKNVDLIGTSLHSLFTQQKKKRENVQVEEQQAGREQAFSPGPPNSSTLFSPISLPLASMYNIFVVVVDQTSTKVELQIQQISNRASHYMHFFWTQKLIQII